MRKDAIRELKWESFDLGPLQAGAITQWLVYTKRLVIYLCLLHLCGALGGVLGWAGYQSPSQSRHIRDRGF